MRLLKKIAFVFILSVLFILYIMLCIKLYYYRSTTLQTILIRPQDKPLQRTTEPGSRKSKDEEKKNSIELKYILQWTPATSVPFIYMGKGRQVFIDDKCPFTNCFVTDDRKYLGGDITKFDVIAFNGPQAIYMPTEALPDKRSPHQKYAFASIESSDYYPVCNNRFDGYFNWSWTFRLDSEIKWGYLVIRDKENNNIVGPKKEMSWIKFEDMDPVSAELKEQLKSKTKAAAWFVSNCQSRSNREKTASDLQKALEKYNLTVDVYGECGPFKCARGDDACKSLIKEKYYFYLSFENSFTEDYVTEKLLNAVQNNALPIVYGAADYTRFLPDHSYLNARELGVENLAAKMNHLIQNPEEYYEYFRWTKYYFYHKKIQSVQTDPYCLICLILNDEEMVKQKTVYQNFREWWDPPGRC